MRLEGWRIAGLVTLCLLVLAASLIATQGFTEATLRSYARTTARFSIILFLLAFSSSSAQALWRRPWSIWMLRNRRYLGVSFAISHSGHLLALILLALYYPHPFLDRLTLFGFVGGSLGYLFIAAMTLTSFKAPRQWLGQKRWQILHTTGGYYLWLVFMQSYAGRAFKDITYLPYVAGLLLVISLRLGRRLRK